MTATKFLAAAAITALSGFAALPANAAQPDHGWRFHGAARVRRFDTFGSGDSFGPWNVTQGSVDLIGTYWQAPH